jgi:hypothetical protein
MYYPNNMFLHSSRWFDTLLFLSCSPLVLCFLYPVHYSPKDNLNMKNVSRIMEFDKTLHPIVNV